MSDPALESILETLRTKLSAWRTTYGLTRLRVYGSLARGDGGPRSDLDIIADFESVPDIFTLAALKLEIEDLTRRRVDLVMQGGLRPAILQNALRDAVPV